MQNGRNRIAAHGRTKAGKGTKSAKAPRRKGAPPEFPKDVMVVAPPGMAVPASFPAGAPKPKPARRKPRPHPTQQRRPGRKKRVAAREAEHRRQTAVVLVAAPKSARAARPANHPQTPEVICLTDGTLPPAAALPLPELPEPLVVGDLPKQRALARPTRGFVAAISAWLGSARRLLALNLLPRKARRPLPKPPRSIADVNRIAAGNAARRQSAKIDA